MNEPARRSVAMPANRDLFDDSTMSFGEHLEILRVHLVRALVGLAIAVVVALFFGKNVVALMASPLNDALERFGHSTATQESDVDKVQEVDMWDQVLNLFKGKESKKEEEKPEEDDTTIEVRVDPYELANGLHEYDPGKFPSPKKRAEDAKEQLFTFKLESESFGDLQKAVKKALTPKPVTLTVQEAFMTYLKVAFVTGFVLASPWVFYQVWLFVAAGLYPHEQRYIHIYLPMSLTLFFGGAAFCFFMVFPFVLDFLLGFNAWLEIEPNIRLTEWISFAIMLPIMFGLSFQLPMVMLFLERISVFDLEAYQTSRRMSILVIAITSMLMTPADPASMLMMMFPLVLLYEFGIFLCKMSPSKREGEPEAV
jgi:sec-independent protein translocase protein TatC